jgi:hypothetical protein
VEVTGLKLPLRYRFQGAAPGGEFTIYFCQQRKEPDADRHTKKFTNVKEFTYPFSALTSTATATD